LQADQSFDPELGSISLEEAFEKFHEDDENRKIQKSTRLKQTSILLPDSP
jgi:hypothetical protein